MTKWLTLAQIRSWVSTYRTFGTLSKTEGRMLGQNLRRAIAQGWITRC